MVNRKKKKKTQSGGKKHPRLSFELFIENFCCLVYTKIGAIGERSRDAEELD